MRRPDWDIRPDRYLRGARLRGVKILRSRGDGARRWLVAGGVGVGVVAAAAAWIGWTANQAHTRLESARAAVPAVQADWQAGRLDAGRARLAAVQADATAAYRCTHDPVWAVAARIPVLGRPLVTLRGITASVHGITGTSLPALVSAAWVGKPQQLLRGPGEVDVDTLAAAAQPLRTAADSLQAERRALEELPGSWVPELADARSTLLDQVEPLAGTVSSAAEAARVVPPMLGLDGTRRYFVGFQNPAEARGTGGLLYAFAIVTATHGKVEVTRVGSTAQLPVVPDTPAAVPPAFTARYGAQGAADLWVNSNLSPDFPEVATAWGAMWKAAAGQRLDGAVALDPEELSAVLRVVGPVHVSGIGTVTAGSVPGLVYTDRYRLASVGGQRTNGQHMNRMLGIGTAVIDALLAGRADVKALLSAVASAARGGHAMVYSADSGEQDVIDRAGVSGGVPSTPRPFAQAVVVNAAGSKLDTYLDSKLVYAVKQCTRSTRRVSVAVTLHNGAPTKGLPDHVVQRDDAPAFPTVPGQNRVDLQVLLTQGAGVRAATLDGAPVELAPPTGQLPDSVALKGSELAPFLDQGEQAGRPSYGLELELPPGATRTVVLTADEPPSSLNPVLGKQPLVRPTKVSVNVAACAGM